MEIKVLQLMDGAKAATGITVIIDVFRCFSLEAIAMYEGVSKIYPTADIDECLRIKKEHPDYIIAGERKGIKIEGFDSGNSPSELVMNFDLKNKVLIHNTASGVQGVVNAKNASEILGGSLLTAKAIAKYIKKKNPEVVSLVCMGWMGLVEVIEDTMCAYYIKDLLEGKDPDVNSTIVSFRDGCGKKFFDKDKPQFPLPDFFMCLMPNIYDFVLKIEYDKDKNIFETKKVLVD